MPEDEKVVLFHSSISCVMLLFQMEKDRVGPKNISPSSAVVIRGWQQWPVSSDSVARIANMNIRVCSRRLLSSSLPPRCLQSRSCSTSSSLVSLHHEREGEVAVAVLYCTVQYSTHWTVQVAVITLNNPAKMNALTEPMGDALGARVAEVAADTKVGAARLKYMSYLCMIRKKNYFKIAYNK